MRRVLGGTLEPGVGSVLAVSGFGVAGMYAMWSFFTLWAIERLGMEAADVGLLFLASAAVGIAGGLTGGRVSDRVGRRPVIVTAGLVQAFLPLLLTAPWSSAPVAAAVLAAMTFVGPVRMAAQQALLADLVPDEKREETFGAARVVFNAGALAGPLLGAALVSVAWPALHVGVAALFFCSFLASLRLPRLAPAAPAGGRPRPVLRMLVSDRAFATLFAAALAAMVVYNAFEQLMPVALTQSHGYAPASWGVLFVVNPVLVMLFQIRVTRWTRGVSPGTKLAVAMVLMGFAFLPLAVTAAPAVLVLLVVVFVAGEMLWAPTADALAARLAPADARGAYLSTLGIATWIGGALAPALGLRARAELGDAAMWAGVALVALVAAALFAAASGLSSGRTRGTSAAPALAASPPTT